MKGKKRLCNLNKNGSEDGVPGVQFAPFDIAAEEGMCYDWNDKRDVYAYLLSDVKNRRAGAEKLPSAGAGGFIL